MVAVALNTDNRLTVIARDVASGMMTGMLGYLNLDIGGQPGGVTSAVWDEDSDGAGGYGGGNVTSTVTSSMTSTLLITVTEASSVASGTSSPAASMPSTGTGYSSPIGVQPSTTSGPSGGASPPPGTAVATPSPFQTGMVGNCTNFYLVVSGDTCSSIATAAGISLSDFYTWNPAVGTSCATLFLNMYWDGILECKCVFWGMVKASLFVHTASWLEPGFCSVILHGGEKNQKIHLPNLGEVNFL